MNNSLYKKYLYTEEQINYLIESVKLKSNLYIPPTK